MLSAKHEGDLDTSSRQFNQVAVVSTKHPFSDSLSLSEQSKENY